MKELKKRMQRDYDNVSDFHRRANVAKSVSYETCRRFFIEEQKISFANFLALLVYLGYSPSEIKSFLKAPDKYVVEDDLQLCKDISYIIGESAVTLNAEEKAMLSAYAKLKDTPCIMFVADSASMCAKAHKIDISDELRAIMRGGGEMRA